MTSSGGSGRINRPGQGVAHFFRTLTGRVRTHSTAFTRFAGRVQRMRGAKPGSVRKQDVVQLGELLDEALADAERRTEELFGHRSFELVRANNATKEQMKRLLDALPPEITETDEFRELLKKVTRYEEEKSNFARGTMLKGTTRSEVRQGEVKRWVEKVDEKLADERSGGGGGSPDEDEPEPEGMRRWTFHTTVDEVRRKKKRGEPVEPRDVELVADRAFELMKGLRQELSPSWTPEERPRWVSAGDKYVYDLALAVVPKELFQDSNGWQGIQRLRAGEEVFTLRAADNIAEAMKRK